MYLLATVYLQYKLFTIQVVARTDLMKQRVRDMVSQRYIRAGHKHRNAPAVPSANQMIRGTQH
jgi:hypothetical protein